MFVLIGSPLSASGHGYRLDGIRIVHPWAMSTAPSITDGLNGMGYMVLRNIGKKPDKLLAAHVEIARKVELHAKIKEGDTFKMLRIDQIEIPAGGEIRLEPGGSHLKLIDLGQSLEEGQHFSVVLQFEHAGTITVEMFVQENAQSSIY